MRTPFAIVALLIWTTGPVRAVPARNVGETLRGLPLLFVENQGQLDRRVAYSLHGTDRTVYFTPSGLTLVRHGAGRSASVKVTFPDARPSVRPEGLGPTPTTMSYWHADPATRRSGVRTWTRLVYRDLWPGIDLEYALGDHRLKYTFHVRPGADPRRIRVAYRGARHLAHTVDGTLAIRTAAGTVEDLRPVAWQDGPTGRVPVAAEYALVPGHSPGERVHGFAVGPYDRARTLELDPAQVVYAGFFAASDTVASCSAGGGITVDDQGNAYIIGNTRNEPGTFPPVVGPITTFGGQVDAFVAKIDPAGAIVYAGYYGSDRNETGDTIAVDPDDGAVYIGGIAVFGDTLPALLAPPPPNVSPMYVAKIDPSGASIVWTRLVPGNGGICHRALAADAAGNVYAVGFTNSDESVFPVLNGPELTFSGPTRDFDDGFVVKLDADGGFVYSGFLGGTKIDSIEAVAADAAGNAFVAGTTGSSEADAFPLAVGPDLTFNGADPTDGLGFGDAFVAKISPTGTILYCGYVGGASIDEADGVGVDATGAAYVAGETKSLDGSFPRLVGPKLSTRAVAGGDGTPFLAKVGADGAALVYSGFLGDGTADRVRLDVDASGNAYVATRASGPADFPAGGAAAPRLGSDGLVLVAKVPQSGQGLEWSTFFGGGGDTLDDLAVDAAGDVFLFGSTFGDASTFPAQGGPVLTPSPSFSDQFYVARLRGTPGNGGGGGGGGVAPCGDPAACQAALATALPNPAAAADKKGRKVAKSLGKLGRAAASAVGKGSGASGKKQERAFRKARKKLEKLVAKAQAAAAGGTLGAPLDAITAAAAACCP